MSDAVPQYGFTQARRGYVPEQVDRALAALTAQRDEAWERLSVLGAGIRQMEARLADIRRTAEEAPEPDYQVLSEQAAGLAAMAENEARAVREKAERFAEDLRDEVYEAGQAADRAAKEYSTTTRTDADAAARRTEERTRAEAEGIRSDTDRESRSARDAATAYAAKVRVAAAEASEQAEAELAARRRKADETFAAAQAAADAEDAEVSATAERKVKEAEQQRETVLNRIKQLETDAQAKADQLVEQARREAEKINAESEREQREFDTRLETVQQHLDHIKATLASLTGAAVGQIEPEVAAAAVAAARAAQDSVGTVVPVAAPAPPAPRDAVADAVVDASPVDSEADTGEIPVADLRKTLTPAAPAGAKAPARERSATVLRTPVVGSSATRAIGGPVATGPVPPKPASPPAEETVEGTAGAEGTAEGAAEGTAEAKAVDGPAAAGKGDGRSSEAETRIVPKIIIVDDGSDYATPHTVSYNRR
ncbi:hypothetical protein ACIQOV_36235 [Kitasatospora sp. NPDC091257]|uniref:hypothetical protein n=1 Tax=Kitasatospora sp. NPDC091257 TaxID=3364084 RepID=UPI0037FC27F8